MAQNMLLVPAFMTHELEINEVKGLLSILSGVALMAMSSMSSAGFISDTVVQDEYVDWWDSHSYTHNLNDDGFDLGSAISGTLSIAISDDGGFWDSGELILFVVEEFDFDTGGVTFGTSFVGDLEVNALGALNADGKLDVTIASLWGDFHVGNSVLSVVTSDDPTSVPEPSTLLLLSIGLLGLGAARRAKA
ncbi:MAG: PEP-CTERM sorting domain-containing protein [Candidatus Thiodiazotropha sp.]